MKGLKFKLDNSVKACKECLEFILCEFGYDGKLMEFMEIVDKFPTRLRKLPESYNKYHHDCETQWIDYSYDILFSDGKGKVHLCRSVEDDNFDELINFYELVTKNHL